MYFFEIRYDLKKVILTKVKSLKPK
jgi:hypothetical protein